MATPPDFTTGQVLTAAQMNAVGMWLVKSDTITTGNSKEITACFSADYDNYKIVLSNIRGSSVVNVFMRMGTTATGVYYYGGLSRSYGSATTNGEQGSGSTQWLLGAIATSTESAAATVELQMPNMAQVTSFSSLGSDPRTGGAGARNYAGYINNTTQYTSMTILLDGGATFSSCNIRVYGYNQ
jgi:hypothetical protein